MSNRYSRRGKRTNRSRLYEQAFKERNVKKVVQYTTPKFPTITSHMRSQLIRQKYVWKMGDSYQKIAEAFYNDPTLWWVLAWYNGKPTDAMVRIGDTIRIPQPLETVLEFFGV